MGYPTRVTTGQKDRPNGRSWILFAVTVSEFGEKQSAMAPLFVSVHPSESLVS